MEEDTNENLIFADRRIRYSSVLLQIGRWLANMSEEPASTGWHVRENCQITFSILINAKLITNGIQWCAATLTAPQNLPLLRDDI